MRVYGIFILSLDGTVCSLRSMIHQRLAEDTGVDATL